MTTAGQVPDRAWRVVLAVCDEGSFTAAARRLGLGQPAVSHAVRQVEQAMGRRVFERRPGGAELVADVVDAVDDIRQAFSRIDRAADRLRWSSAQGTQVSLSVSTPLATYWLMPRLAGFRLAHPDIDVRITTTDTDEDVGVDDADLWIPLGRGPWPGLRSWPFQQERIYPVAAPDHPLARPEVAPHELLEADLLAHEERYRPRFDWPRWFSSHGVELDRTLPRPAFNDYSLVVHAALEGQGVALGWHHIVVELVAEGRLARVGGDDVVTDAGFEILADDGHPPSDAVAAVCDWLRDQAGAGAAT